MQRNLPRRGFFAKRSRIPPPRNSSPHGPSNHFDIPPTPASSAPQPLPSSVTSNDRNPPGTPLKSPPKAPVLAGSALNGRQVSPFSGSPSPVTSIDMSPLNLADHPTLIETSPSLESGESDISQTSASSSSPIPHLDISDTSESNKSSPCSGQPRNHQSQLPSTGNLPLVNPPLPSAPRHYFPDYVPPSPTTPLPNVASSSTTASSSRPSRPPRMHTSALAPISTPYTDPEGPWERLYTLANVADAVTRREEGDFEMGFLLDVIRQSGADTKGLADFSKFLSRHHRDLKPARQDNYDDESESGTGY
ncbi:hypothetical protein TWF281_006696 [Arthrobotrys megalospora]